MTSTLGGTALVTFGSDAAIEAVLSRIADTDGREEFPVWGALSEGDGDMFRAATAGLEGVPVFCEGPFRLDAEGSARVFEALCDYATGEVACEPDVGVHVVVTEWEPEPEDLCDCQLRDRAWSWASDIAGMFLVEMV